MKNIRPVFLGLIFTALPILAHTPNLPAGSAGRGEPRRDPGFRALSRSIATTRVPVTIYGCGTANIDGVLSAGEWSGAGTETITVNTPAGPVLGTVYFMNDNLNLYVALKYPESVANYASFGVEFDNNNNGVALEEGDDALVANNQSGLFDDYRTLLPPCKLSTPCGPEDTDGGGTKDGAMAYHNDGTYSVYEMAHQLNSGDTGHDFALGEGQTVGFFVEIIIIDSAGNDYSTFYPDFGVYDRYIVSGCVPLVTACGTPTLDGIISAGEWKATGEYRLSIRTPHRGTTPATLHVMNDSFNLYVALSYDHPSLYAADDFVVEFDVNDNKFSDTGDDAISYDKNLGFNDLVWSTVSFDFDTHHGGTNDGAGALANNGVQTAFELSHPLNSGDTDDFAMTWVYPNGVMGYALSVRTIDSGFVYPDDFGDTLTRFKYLSLCVPNIGQSMSDLGRGVNQLASGGALSAQNADTLRKDLAKANDNLAAKKTKQAANDLGNFVMDVQKMIRKGDLSDKLGRPMITAANNAISQM